MRSSASTASTPSTMLASTASRSLRSRVSVPIFSSSSSAMELRLSATAANSRVRGTNSLWVKSPPARRSAPSLISPIWPLMRRDTKRPMSAASTATTTVARAMRQYRSARAWFTRVRGIAARTTAVTAPSCTNGTATYIISSSSVVLCRIDTPTPPATASRYSGRSLWSPISAGTESESASTVPGRFAGAGSGDQREPRTGGSSQPLHQRLECLRGAAVEVCARPARARAALEPEARPRCG